MEAITQHLRAEGSLSLLKDPNLEKARKTIELYQKTGQLVQEALYPEIASSQDYIIGTDEAYDAKRYFTLKELKEAILNDDIEEEPVEQSFLM